MRPEAYENEMKRQAEITLTEQKRAANVERVKLEIMWAYVCEHSAELKIEDTRTFMNLRLDEYRALLNMRMNH